MSVHDFKNLLDWIHIHIHRLTYTAIVRLYHRHNFHEKESQKTNIHEVETRTITRFKCYSFSYRCSVTYNTTYSVAIPKQYLLKPIFVKLWPIGGNDESLFIFHCATFRWNSKRKFSSCFISCPIFKNLK
jgi:hypothetical protein